MILNKKTILNLLVCFLFLVLWLFLWYLSERNTVSTFKVYAGFGAFIVVVVELVIDIIKKKINIGIWETFFIHYFSASILTTIYIYLISSSLLIDAILINLSLITWLLIQYSYENNRYYGEE